MIAGAAAVWFFVIRPRQAPPPSADGNPTTTANEEAPAPTEPEDTQPVTTQLTIEAFEALLAELPFTVDEIRGEEGCTGFSVKNNWDAAVSEFVLGMVGWTEDGLPFASNIGGAYYGELGLDQNINILSGDIFSVDAENFADHGGYNCDADYLPLHADKMMVVVVSCTGFDGSRWENPYLSAFKEAFVGVAYRDNMTVTIVPENNNDADSIAMSHDAGYDDVAE